MPGGGARDLKGIGRGLYEFLKVTGDTRSRPICQLGQELCPYGSGDLGEALSPAEHHRGWD